MTVEEIKARITAIDAMLDDDTISDAEYDRLEQAARELTKKLGKLESQAWLCDVKSVKTLDAWTQEFLASFGTKSQTRKITLNQARIFCRINAGKPFIYNGIRYDCRGMDYRAGFSSVVITKNP